MAGTLTKIPPNGGGPTNGRGVVVTATTSGTAQLVHTAQASATLSDCITLYAFNNDTNNRTLYYLWGGTTTPDDVRQVTVAPQAGLLLVIPGMPLWNGATLKVYADVASKIVLDIEIIRES